MAAGKSGDAQGWECRATAPTGWVPLYSVSKFHTRCRCLCVPRQPPAMTHNLQSPPYVLSGGSPEVKDIDAVLVMIGRYGGRLETVIPVQSRLADPSKYRAVALSRVNCFTIRSRLKVDQFLTPPPYLPTWPYQHRQSARPGDPPDKSKTRSGEAPMAQSTPGHCGSLFSGDISR